MKQVLLTIPLPALVLLAIGLLGVMVSISTDEHPREKRRLSWLGSLTCLLLGVLFIFVPVPTFLPFSDVSIPIYGYGAMLFLAFVFCTWLASRMAKQEGIAPRHNQDIAIWLFVFGILGARVTFMIQYGVPLWQLFSIWDGGLVFYGSALGGVVGYFVAYFLVLRKYGISTWKMADIIAPCAALGLSLGRFGCLLNGCCYGNVACPDCPSISFPLSAPPKHLFVAKGYQTVAGFTLVPGLPGTGDTNVVARVEPGSPAESAGLRPGDHIVDVDGKDLTLISLDEIFHYWDRDKRGKNDVTLKVERGGNLLTLPAFKPWTIGLHPTQLYESVSTGLLFLLLMAYYPFRRHDGEVMVLFMLCYAVHRFLNEMLRVDTEPITIGIIETNMTLSQNTSILVFVAGLLLGAIVLRRPALATPVPG